MGRGEKRGVSHALAARGENILGLMARKGDRPAHRSRGPIAGDERADALDEQRTLEKFCHRGVQRPSLPLLRAKNENTEGSVRTERRGADGRDARAEDRVRRVREFALTLRIRKPCLLGAVASAPRKEHYSRAPTARACRFPIRLRCTMVSVTKKYAGFITRGLFPIVPIPAYTDALGRRVGC